MKKFFSFLCGIIALMASCFTFAFTDEQIDAYYWAYEHGLTTQPTIESARMNSPLTRQAFSKMVINYLENVAGVKRPVTKICSFTDENRITEDLKPYAQKVCGYDIMGTNGKKFSPTQPLDRAQLGTVFSRILWGDMHDVDDVKGYYIYHVNALQDAEIMNNIQNVKGSIAKRGDAMIMFKRMYEKYGSDVYLNNKSYSPNYSLDAVNYDLDSVLNQESNEKNIIYISSSGTEYYYNPDFLKMIKELADEIGESDLANYLNVQINYYQNVENLKISLQNETASHETIGTETAIDLDQLEQEEKEIMINLIKNTLEDAEKQATEINEQYLMDLKNIVEEIQNDKFGLEDNYEKTDEFINLTSSRESTLLKSINELLESKLNNEEVNSDTFFGVALGVVILKGRVNTYEIYQQEWAINAISILSGALAK